MKNLTIRLFLTLTLLVPSLLMADYVAYSVDEEGAKLPLPEDITPLGAESLLNVQWGEYSGKKTRIGVLEVENNSSTTTVKMSGWGGGEVTYDAGTGGVPVQGIEAIITDIMHNTGRFRLVERQVLDDAIREQDLGASGRVAQPSAAKIGNILGAQYLFQAVVTNYEDSVEKKGGGLLGGVGGSAGAILGGIGMKSSKGVIGMNFRLIDSETTEVIYTDQVEIAIKESGLTFGGIGLTGGAGLGGFMSNYAKTPIGQAVISACNKGVYGLIKQIGTSATTGSVIQVRDDKIYLNLGSDDVSVGETMRIVSVGEELIDPETGISLGGEEETIGMLEVTKTTEKYSLATSDMDLSRISRGDKVVSTLPPEPLQFGSARDLPENTKKGLFGNKKK